MPKQQQTEAEAFVDECRQKEQMSQTRRGETKPNESQDSAGPTPKEYGDRWEPLRSKLTIAQAQYLNTYTRTGDITALNALVLGIISQRDKLQQQRDDLLAACRGILAAYKAIRPKGQRIVALVEAAEAAIAAAEGRHGEAEGRAE